MPWRVTVELGHGPRSSLFSCSMSWEWTSDLELDTYFSSPPSVVLLVADYHLANSFRHGDPLCAVFSLDPER